MLTPEMNDRIARVGPGTPCGELMRRYWIPALLSEEIPTSTFPDWRGLSVVDALIKTGLASSRGDARRAIEQGGMYVNQERVQADRPMEESDWRDGFMLLRKGKRDYALLKPT